MSVISAIDLHFYTCANCSLCVLHADLTQRPPDLVQLVHVRLPGPQRDPRQQLGKHAADGPHVHRGAVLSVSHQQLGGPVPTGGHVVRVVVTWSSCRIKSEQLQGHSDE